MTSRILAFLTGGASSALNMDKVRSIDLTRVSPGSLADAGRVLIAKTNNKPASIANNAFMGNAPLSMNGLLIFILFDYLIGKGMAFSSSRYRTFCFRHCSPASWGQRSLYHS